MQLFERGMHNAQQGARDQSTSTRRERDAEEVGGKVEMPTEQPNNLLVNPELDSSHSSKKTKKEDLVAEKLGRKPGSRKLEGKPDSEESVRAVILGLEHIVAPTNIAKSIYNYSIFLYFQRGKQKNLRSN
jgi:hypothetical protein